jgi:hypothetical protein
MPNEPDNELIPFRPFLAPEQLDPDGTSEDANTYERGLGASQSLLVQIFPISNIELSPEQRIPVEQQRLASVVMDSAGAAALRCAETCPFRAECSLYRFNKHPLNQLCPWDVDFLRERFVEWMRELGRTLDNLLASERMAIGSLCSLQLELRNVRRILSRPQNVEMNQISVRDVNAQTGDPICWENVIHTAAQREDQILTNIRMIMKDFELTPEQRTRRAKALGLRFGDDLATKQSGLLDKIRERRQKLMLNITPALPAPAASS